MADATWNCCHLDAFCVHRTTIHHVTSLHARPHTQGACMFSCKLPPALLAEHLKSFTWYCGNTGDGTVTKIRVHRKLTLENKFSHCSYLGSNLQPIDHKSRVLTTELSLLPMFHVAGLWRRCSLAAWSSFQGNHPSWRKGRSTPSSWMWSSGDRKRRYGRSAKECKRQWVQTMHLHTFQKLTVCFWKVSLTSVRQTWSCGAIGRELEIVWANLSSSWWIRDFQLYNKPACLFCSLDLCNSKLSLESNWLGLRSPKEWKSNVKKQEAVGSNHIPLNISEIYSLLLEGVSNFRNANQPVLVEI